MHILVLKIPKFYIKILILIYLHFILFLFSDLFGILKFLDVNPYCVHEEFQRLMTSDPDYMYSWFSNIIWRNVLEDVNSELNIPKITHEQHLLTISQIEKHFYQSQHNKCANDFSNIATRYVFY